MLLGKEFVESEWELFAHIILKDFLMKLLIEAQILFHEYKTINNSK